MRLMCIVLLLAASLAVVSARFNLGGLIKSKDTKGKEILRLPKIKFNKKGSRGKSKENGSVDDDDKDDDDENKGNHHGPLNEKHGKWGKGSNGDDEGGQKGKNKGHKDGKYGDWGKYKYKDEDVRRWGYDKDDDNYDNDGGNNKGRYKGRKDGNRIWGKNKDDGDDNNDDIERHKWYKDGKYRRWGKDKDDDDGDHGNNDVGDGNDDDEDRRRYGRNNRTSHCDWCVRNAKCTRRSGICRCVCQESYEGNGYFLCYKPDEENVCLLCDDPVVTTVNADSARVPYVGSTLLQDVTKQDGSGTRRARVIVSNYRSMGRSLPRAVFIIVEKANAHGTVTCSFIYKVVGYVKGRTLVWVVYRGKIQSTSEDITSLNHYATFQSNSRNGAEENKCNCKVLFQVQPGKILEVYIKCCSLKVGFRPFIKKSDWLKSGIYVTFDKPSDEIEELPPSTTVDYPLCLRPGVPVCKLQKRFGLEERFTAMSFLALTNLGPEMTFNHAPPSQANMAAALLTCDADERNIFYEEAGFMVDYHPFITCISENYSIPIGSASPDLRFTTVEADIANKSLRFVSYFEEIMKLVSLTAYWICDSDADSCREANRIIHERCEGLLISKPEIVSGLQCR